MTQHYGFFLSTDNNMVNLVATAVDQLRVYKQFPHQIDSRPDIRIPLSDGFFLHARLWLPDDAAVNPVPAVIEYAPFRHRDFTAPRDALIHPWFAGHGYASLRIELRGSGDSTGLPQDEYILQEQYDAVEPDTGRTLGTYLPAPGTTWAADRIFAGSNEMVGSMVEKYR